jgi:O-antigen/teichoic acid export membrane protein
MRFFRVQPLNTTLALQLFQMMRLGSAVLTGVLLAKSGLGTAEIGAWEMLLYTGTTLTFFWVNGLLQGIAPVFAQQEGVERKVFIFNNFLVFCALALLLFILLIAGERWLTPALTGLPQVPHFNLFAVYLLFNLPAFPVEYYYLLHEKPRSIVGWGVVSFGLHLAAIFFPIHAGFGLEGGLSALIGWSILRFLWATGLALRYGIPRLNRRMIAAYLVFCAPLMLSNVVSNLMLLYDNWLVGRYYADAAVFAVYRYGAREFPLATALVIALGASMVPLLAASPAEGMAALKIRSRRLMHGLFPLTIVLLCFSGQIFPLVFNADFKESAVLFNIYLLTLASRVLLPASIVLAKGDSRAIFRISLFELGVKFVLGWVFIHHGGLNGLAWSVVVSFWVEKIGLIWVLENKYHIRTTEWLDWKWYLFWVFALFFTYMQVA